MTKARKMLKDAFKIIYKNDPETRLKEEDMLDSMSDQELKRRILNDEIYVYVKPFKEPSLKDIKEFADFLNIELDEKLILPAQNNIVTEHPCPLGYAPIKLLEQLVYKKVVTSHDVAEVDPITGQSTTNSKTRMITAPELINAFSNKEITKSLFPEYLSARSDDAIASDDMHKQIAETGRFSVSKMKSTGIGQIQKTLSAYLIGSGIDNDIVQDHELKVDGTTLDIR